MLVERYRPILYLQYFLLFVDLFMNSFIELLRFENVILLVLLVIQDLCIMFAVIVIFLLFFNTYIFQAGLVNILINKFKVVISVTFIYFALCVGLHVWYMTLRWKDPDAYIWDTAGLRVLFIVQRTGIFGIFVLSCQARVTVTSCFVYNSAVLYYYFYKRSSLKLGDPRFYQESDWIRKEFEKRR